jgi:hypothetical protein
MGFGRMFAGVVGGFVFGVIIVIYPVLETL